MAYKFSFADNEIYSASDVNEITKRLVTSGVEDTFSDGVSYNVSKFNELGKLLYTDGVVPESNQTLKVTKVSDDEILINPGLAFFADGATITIEVGGESLKFTLGVRNYVYLKNELTDKNICYPVCSQSEPAGDFVLLAEIDEEGNIEDRRIYARGKLPGYQSNSNGALFFKETMYVPLSTYSGGKAEAEFAIGENTFKYIIISNAFEDTPYLPNLSLYRISDGGIVSFGCYSDEKIVMQDDEIYTYNGSYSKRYTVKLSLNDGILKVEAEVNSASNSMGDIGDNIPVELNFIFV